MIEGARVIRRLRLAHISMQAQDTEAQMAHDARAVFERALERHYAWFTGTEAGGASPLNTMLAKEAKAAGYKFARPKGQDCWVAVSKDLVDDGWSTYFDEIIKADGQKPGKHTAKGVVAASWENEGLGPITVIIAHYLTKGRPGSGPDTSVNVEKNQRLARAIGAYAKEKGKGRALVFYGGDQNIVDRTNDTFFGEPLTSSWDEVKKWEGTGHGNIDVIASYDPDSRVEAVSARSIPDSQFFLYSDHKLVESEFNIQLLRGKR